MDFDLDYTLGGLSLAVMVLAIVSLTLSVFRWYLGKKDHILSSGYQLLITVGLFYLLLGHLFNIVPPDYRPLEDEFRKAVGTVWWLLLWYVLKQTIDKLLWYGLLAAEKGRSAVPRFIINVFNVFLFIVVVSVVLNTIYNQPIAPLLATSGAAAFIFGYSAQSTLTQIFSGISLNLSTSFKEGDTIIVNDLMGIVREMNWRCVVLEDDNSNHIIVPNEQLAGNVILNCSISPPTERSLEFYVHISYPPEKVVALVKEAALNCPHILRTPEPLVYVQRFKRSGVLYALDYCITDIFNRKQIHGEVASLVWNVLRKNNVPLPFAQQILLDRFDKHHYDYAPEDITASQAAFQSQLNQLAFFKGFNNTTKKRIAEQATYNVFYRGERIIDEGENTQSLIVLIEGDAEVFTLKGTEELKLATLNSPMVVGEMSFLTGEPRSASVRATSLVKAYEIPKHAIESAFKQHPDAIDILAQRMADYKLQNEQTENKYQKAQAAKKKEEYKLGFLDSIRKLFNMD